MNKLLRSFPESEILSYWFGSVLEDENALAVQAPLWFSGGSEVDHEISTKFGAWFEPISELRGEDFEAKEPLLAAVILFDQFSRNCFRGQERAFYYDVFALDLLDYAMLNQWDQAMHPLQRAFLYMPLQHIESLDGQELGVRLFRGLADAAPQGYEKVLSSNAEFALEHRDIIQRFGRFPHRNSILKRNNTSEEQAYLDAGAKRYGQ